MLRTPLPDPIVWKSELLFRGVKYTPELSEAVAEGAAPGYWPYRKVETGGSGKFLPVPYLFQLGKAVARVRVHDAGAFEVRRDGSGFALWDGGRQLCAVEFVRAHSWQSFRTTDGASYMDAGVEQLGDMLVVNLTPGCEYFLTKSGCSFCGYGRFSPRTQALGQIPGVVRPAAKALDRFKEVMTYAAGTGEARHVYIVGGSALSVEDEAERFLPVIEIARKCVGDRLRVTAGSGAVDLAGSRRYRDAGADSCCYNLETWDAATFEAACPGKAKYIGRDRWIQGLVDAVEVFGHGNVASAFVAGLEMRPPAPGMSEDAMLASIREGAEFLLSRGIMPLYSPLWPVEGTVYGPKDGISSELYLQLEAEVYQLRAAHRFPVPGWLICPGCSYMLLEVDFDVAFGLAPGSGLQPESGPGSNHAALSHAIHRN
ncbi:MAG TPA: radical SAM protein [Bryobacteraceae bacterium]|nr:radical SAM protein [Bryobacteraceae bacterium]